MVKSRYEARSPADFRIGRPAAAQTPTIYLIGDATVRSGHQPAAVNQWGWGERLTDFIDSGKANLVNLAGGSSNRTFYNITAPHGRKRWRQSSPEIS